MGSALDLTDLSSEVWTSPPLSFWSVNRMSENTLVVIHWSNQVLTASHLTKGREVGNGLRRHLLGGTAVHSESNQKQPESRAVSQKDLGRFRALILNILGRCMIYSRGYLSKITPIVRLEKFAEGQSWWGPQEVHGYAAPGMG